MGSHFHDLGAGTATPRSYEFAWNDDVIAMNQFAGVLTDATQGVAAALNTSTTGTPIVVFNPLNIEREDLVEADVKFPEGEPKACASRLRTGRKFRRRFPTGRWCFWLACPPSATRFTMCAPAPRAPRPESQLEGRPTARSRTSTIACKSTTTATSPASSTRRSTRNCLPLPPASPSRMTILCSGRRGTWIGTRSRPRRRSSSPARRRFAWSKMVLCAWPLKFRGKRPARVLCRPSGFPPETRESAWNLAISIDWNTRESNLKATFPLAASNEMATYNWDIGTIQRPTAEPKKFEVPSHQWIDLTDMSGEVRGDHPDRLQERIGQAERQHHSAHADSHARRSRRLSRPGHAGSWTS